MSKLYPRTMNENLQPVWCTINNEITRDEEAIKVNLDRVVTIHRTNEFLANRIITNKKALEALGGIV